MSKQIEQQRFILKIHSNRLAKNKWDLSLQLDEARRNGELISLASSQVLRWIDELNGIVDSDEIAKNIKREIRALRKEDNSTTNKKNIRLLYKQLDEIQYKPDYMCLIIDKNSHYHRACKGFYINNVKYVRLLGTNGGVKNSTIIFVSERLAPELRKRIENGRDQSCSFVPAKLEAYKALACSASVPVSYPAGVLVVDDVETTFKCNYRYLTDENDGEPIMTDLIDENITIDASDGYGIMSPELSSIWSSDLGLDYIMTGCCIRNSWTKGMVYTFDFKDFANKIAGTYEVMDAWGFKHDIRDIDLILTTSMLKLWNSYGSYDEYLANCLENKYTFSVTKTSPKELENEHTTNYQFVQTHSLTDTDIDELTAPTINEIKDVLNGDWRKTLLYLKGKGMNENNVISSSDDYIKAIMIDERMVNDPFVQSSIYQFIRNRINEAKVGVLRVHGNYSMASGDPYLLCQNIFGLEPTGLLKPGEIYNKYWADDGAKEVVCFRAPMSAHNNILKMIPANNDDVNYWYKYMTTCTIFNGWDMSMASLNGMD